MLGASAEHSKGAIRHGQSRRFVCAGVAIASARMDERRGGPASALDPCANQAGTAKRGGAMALSLALRFRRGCCVLLSLRLGRLGPDLGEVHAQANRFPTRRGLLVICPRARYAHLLWSRPLIVGHSRPFALRQSGLAWLRIASRCPVLRCRI